MSKKSKPINDDYSFAYSSSSGYNPFEALKSLGSDHEEASHGTANPAVIELMFERKGRNGKPVTLIRGLPEQDLESHAKALKNLCGVGGSFKEGEILLQGNQREKCEGYFKDKGFKTKKIGG